MEECERPSPYKLCTIGLFCSFLWAGLVYFFINMLNLPKSWSLVCSYFVFTIIIWSIFYVSYKCHYSKKKEDIKIHISIQTEPPKYTEKEIISPPDYNSSTEEIV